MKISLYRSIGFSLLLGTLFSPLGADELLDKGIEALRQDRVEEAVRHLENAFAVEKETKKIAFYLSLAYQRWGDSEKAERYTLLSVDGKRSLGADSYFNAGNFYLAQGRHTEAVEMYTKALDEGEGGAPGAPSRLNRANTYAVMQRYEEAVQDYRIYVDLVPPSEKRTRIERVIVLLEGEIHQREAKEERAERQATERERQQLREAQREREAASHKQALLGEIHSSLEDASGATENLTGGKEAPESSEETSDIGD